MKAAIALKRLVTGMGLFLLCCGGAGAADAFTAFGLNHSLLTNTVLTTSESPGLRIENVSRLCPEEPCDFLDGFGVTVHLGEAESGLFAYPDDAGALLEVETFFSGYLLEGLAFGSVDGMTNRPISSLSATRAGWGEYAMSVDFSALGATNYTYELFSDGLRTLFATNQGPGSGLSTYDIEPGVPPRANPFWRFPDGSGFGAVIELPGVTRFYIPNGASGVGERLVIRPEGATSRVDYVSYVNIVGSEGLPRFAIEDERLGMFGLAHRALDGVTLSATNRELTIAGFSKAPTQGMEGVMIEVPRGLHWEGTFRELSLSNDNTSLLLSAAGTSSTNRGGAFYGPVGVTRSAGTSGLQADFSGLCATGVVVEARMNGLPAGRLVLSVMGTLGTLAATNPTVLRCSASARDSTAGASFAFALAEGTTFTATAGGELIGDEFRLSPAAPGEVVGTLKHVILQGSGLDRLTLTNESTHAESPPVLVMEIERAGPGVVFSWPDVAHIYPLEKRGLSDERWETHGLLTYRYADFRLHATLPQLTNTMGYFHLEYYFNHYIYSGRP